MALEIMLLPILPSRSVKLIRKLPFFLVRSWVYMYKEFSRLACIQTDKIYEFTCYSRIPLFFFLLPWIRNRKKKREMLKDCNKQSWLAVFFHNKRRADVLNLFASDIMKLCWLHVYIKLFFPPTDWEWYIDNGRTRSTSGDTSCFRVSCGVYGVHR